MYSIRIRIAVLFFAGGVCFSSVILFNTEISHSILFSLAGFFYWHDVMDLRIAYFFSPGSLISLAQTVAIQPGSLLCCILLFLCTGQPAVTSVATGVPQVSHKQKVISV